MKKGVLEGEGRSAAVPETGSRRRSAVAMLVGLFLPDVICYLLDLLVVSIESSDRLMNSCDRCCCCCCLSVCLSVSVSVLFCVRSTVVALPCPTCTRRPSDKCLRSVVHGSDHVAICKECGNQPDTDLDQ